MATKRNKHAQDSTTCDRVSCAVAAAARRRSLPRQRVASAVHQNGAADLKNAQASQAAEASLAPTNKVELAQTTQPGFVESIEVTRQIRRWPVWQ